MKKALILIILVCVCAVTKAQTGDNPSQVYTLKYQKVSSPEYKNHFDEIHKAKSKSVNVISEPTKLKGPNYKNRRFKE